MTHDQPHPDSPDDEHDPLYSLPKDTPDQVAWERAQVDSLLPIDQPNVSLYLEDVVAAIFSSPQNFKNFIALPTAKEKLFAMLRMLNLDLELAISRYGNPDYGVEDYL